MSPRGALRALLVLGLVLVIAAPAAATRQSGPERVPLVAVDFDDAAHLQRLLEAGLDIVEVDDDAGTALVALHRFDRAYLAREGIRFEIVQANVNTFPETSDVGTSEHGGRTDYRYLADYYSELDDIASSYPGLTRLETIGYSIENRPIKAIEISSDPGADDGRPEHVHMALHHAREWPSGELALDLAWHLVENYGSDQRITDILDSTRVFVIPVVNPDGFNFSRTVYPLWRKNRNPSGAVDLNRNYSYYWGGPGSSGSTGSQTYRGTAAFSEPESRAIRDFLLGRHSVTLITGHTHGGYWLYPWGHKSPSPPDSSELATLAAQSVEGSGYLDGQTSIVLYTASGDTTDWGYGTMRSLAYTPEYGTSGSFHPPYQGSTSYPHVVTDDRQVEGRLMQDSIPVSGENGLLVDCGLALQPSDCPPGTAGKIALIERGSATFANKGLNAAAAGAIGAVIYNNTSGHINGTLAGVSVPIPVIGIPRSGGLDLLDDMAAGDVEATLENIASDSYAYLWNQQLPAFLLNIEAADDYAARITGTVTDASTGAPVTADFTLSRTRWSFDAYGNWYNHDHTASMTATGSFDWSVLPSQQPEVSSNAYTLTVSASGYSTEQHAVTLGDYGSTTNLSITLDPVGGFQASGDATSTVAPATAGAGSR